LGYQDRSDCDQETLLDHDYCTARLPEEVTAAAPQPAKVALTGRVVTMSDSFAVLPRGTIYIDNGSIVAVQPADQPAPSDFVTVPAVETGGTIYPGLIELHNHLSYNALQLWQVPEAFDPAKGSLATWLTVVSRRRAVDQLRKRRGEIDVADVVVPTAARQLADVAQNQITDKVRLCLEGMPEKLRVTFELAYMQGLTHSEISERTGDPLGTTKSRIRLALNWIRKKLDNKCPDGNGHV